MSKTYVVRTPIMPGLGMAPKVGLQPMAVRRFANLIQRTDLNDDEAVASALNELFAGSTVMVEFGMVERATADGPKNRIGLPPPGFDPRRPPGNQNGS